MLFWDTKCYFKMSRNSLNGFFSQEEQETGLHRKGELEIKTVQTHWQGNKKKCGCRTNFSDLLRYERAQWLPMDLSWTGTGWNWDESTCLLNPKHFIWNICVLYEPFHFYPPLLAEMFAKLEEATICCQTVKTERLELQRAVHCVHWQN